MLAGLAAFWAGLPKWARDAIMIAGAVLAVIFLGRQYIKGRENAAVSKDRQKQAVETAKARAELVETSNREIQNVQDAKDAAVAAPDTVPEFGSADELRQQAPAIGRVILPHRGEDQPGS